MKVIVDTDISGDVDDALTLALLGRRELDVLAMTLGHEAPGIAPAIDAVNPIRLIQAFRLARF
ncbi:hypothetical protein [Croceicoccus naphthovorans]|uniref:Uncharacterized protein n=1 Tax=Croceicoccus naphthovorans TaxID=1348774 RepID=A0A0G3XI73_9SPHN|nr:hypothetical protein [Croceicoccus naphthovorans]AKM10028.1 hypothetical protein AB433_08640 [Croceicoccus naphthovorans]MBB3991086.1 inosine-uridine nucleoside N-ribohydrolase [Croceicoccus naphthovorans]